LALCHATTAVAQQEAAPAATPSAVTGGARELAYGTSGLAGVPGRVVLSGERLASFASWSSTIEVTGTTPAMNTSFESSGTSVGLLWAAGAPVPVGAINPYVAPRLALDVFVHPNLTVGGSIGYASASGSAHQSAPVQGQDVSMPTASTLVLAPRVGVAFSPSEIVSIWLRGGITYSHASVEDTEAKMKSGNDMLPGSSLSWDQVSLSLDPMLVLVPFSHFGIEVGPTIDVPLSNSIDVSGSTTAAEAHLELANYGIAAGILGFF
jgi:hypothetical protein